MNVVGSNGGSLTPKDSASTTTLAMTSRPMPLSMQLNGTSPHPYVGYEAPLTGRSAPMSRGVFNTRFPIAPPPSPMFGFETDVCRMVVFLLLNFLSRNNFYINVN